MSEPVEQRSGKTHHHGGSQRKLSRHFDSFAVIRTRVGIILKKKAIPVPHFALEQLVIVACQLNVVGDRQTDGIDEGTNDCHWSN